MESKELWSVRHSRLQHPSLYYKNKYIGCILNAKASKEIVDILNKNNVKVGEMENE